MKALLDTHTFLWAIAKEEKLSRRAQQIFTGPNDLWLSVASVWEILIKVRAGRLPLPVPAGPYVVKKLAAVPVDGERPKERIDIRRISVVTNP